MTGERPNGPSRLHAEAPRSLADPRNLRARMDRLGDSHVKPLNDWVRDIRRRLGPSAIVPWFDPDDAGTHARILWLLEAPGPKATTERGGSGFVSCDNNDGTAHNTWETRTDAGVRRDIVIHWNVIPFYIGDERGIRAWTVEDLQRSAGFLEELLTLVPDLSAVILGGRAAQKAWSRLPQVPDGLEVIACPHPSPTNLNTRPAARSGVIDGWRRALDAATR